MNHVYRLVFNSSRGLIQVASELGSVGGKHRDRRRTRGKHLASEAQSRPARTPLAAALVLAVGITAPLLSSTPARAATAVPSATGANGGPGSNGTALAGGAGGTGTGGTTYPNQGGHGGYNGFGYGGGYGVFGVSTGPVVPPYDYGGGGYGGASNGYAGYFGGAGGGGGGGAPARIFSAGSYQLGYGNSLIGGAGGAGGKAFYSSAAGQYVASAGSGGNGAAGTSGKGFTLTSHGTIGGGTGGAGNIGFYGSNGGTGGTGVYIGRALSPAMTYITNGSASDSSAVISGGAGAAAGNSYGGYGHRGGYGGAGVYAFGTAPTYSYSSSTPAYGLVLTNYGAIRGGAGGAGGTGTSTGWGGRGGYGVTGSYMTVVNEASGKIYGGNGGVGSSTPGAGIWTRDGTTIINSGTIGGGRDNAGGGSYQAYAVSFRGNNNTLKLLAGYKLIGDATCFGGFTYYGNTLELGGSTNGNMVGSMGSFGTASPNFFDFNLLRKTGTSTWTVTTTTSTTFNLGIPIWEIQDGILQVAGGDNYNASSFYSISIGIKPTASTTTTPGVDNAELDVTGSANLNSEALLVNPASGTYVDGVQYNLVHAAGGVIGTFGSVTFSPALPGTITPSVTYTATDVYLTLTGSGSIGGGGGSGGGGGGGSGGGGGGAFGLLSLAGLFGVARWNRKARSDRRKA